MFFFVFATDRHNRVALRKATKIEHMAHLDAPPPGVMVLQSGPWLGPDGEEAGSLIVLQAENETAVQAFVHDDPYNKAGLFDRIETHKWHWRRGNPYLAERAASSTP
jgi:hypothetical protein